MFKEIWLYIKQCFHLSYSQAWTSANNIWGLLGTLLFSGLISFMITPQVVDEFGLQGMTDAIKAMICVFLTFIILLVWRMFFIAPFKLYRGNRGEIKGLNEKILPKFILACGRDIRGCRVPTTMPVPDDGNQNIEYCPTGTTTSISYPRFPLSKSKIKIICLRLAVTADCIGSINDCKGVIEIIEKDGERLNEEGIDVPFAMGGDEDAYSKAIRDNIMQFLDILFITEYNQITLPESEKGYPASINIDEIFNTLGEYILHVAVAGDNTKTAKAKLRFNWTGDWQTAELSLIK